MPLCAILHVLGNIFALDFLRAAQTGKFTIHDLKWTVLLVGYKSIPREALFTASVRTGYRVFFTQTPVVIYPIVREQIATIFTNTVSLRTNALQMMVKITAVDSLTTPLRADQLAKPAPPFLGV